MAKNSWFSFPPAILFYFFLRLNYFKRIRACAPASRGRGRRKGREADSPFEHKGSMQGSIPGP